MRRIKLRKDNESNNAIIKSNKVLNSIYRLKNKISTLRLDDISMYSATCAYYTILSFIPFIILVLTIIQLINIDESKLYYLIVKFLPSSISQGIVLVIKEASSNKVGTISLSIVATLYSAGKGLFALEKGLNKIYNSKKKSKYVILRLKAILGIVVFVICIVVGMLLLVFSEVILDRVNMYLNISFLPNIISKVSFLIVSILAYLAIYELLSENRLTIVSQVKGSIIGAICLNIVSFVFSRYLDVFTNFTLTYGSLTTLMLIMMWVYSCFYTIFIGAKINSQNIH